MCHSGVNRRPGFQTRRPSGPRGKKPTISALGASSGEQWFANRTLTITGSNFGDGATVSFGSTGGISSSFSAGTLTFTIPEHELFEAGTKNVTVTYNGLTSAAATYTVTQPSSLYAGYRADSGIITNAGNVSQWSDYSGNGRHITQTNSGNQPLYVASSANFNSRPAVKFDSSTYLNFTLAAEKPKPNTFFAVANQHSAASAYSFVFSSATTSNQYGLAYLSNGNLTAWAGSSTALLQTSTNKSGVTIPAILTDTGTAATTKVFYGDNNANVASNAYAGNFQNLVVGNCGWSTTYSGVTIGELLVFDTTLSDSQIAILNRYAASRYGANVVTKVDAAPMPAARGFAAAAQLKDGRVVVAGGQDASNVLSRSVQLYDPSTNTWANGPDIPATVYSATKEIRANIAKLGNGKIFLYTGDSAYGATFDGTSWTLTSNAVATAHGPGSKVVAMSNGKVGIFGGASTGTKIDIYDPATNSFSASTATMTSRAYWGAAVSLANGKVLLIAGDSTNKGCEIYDPVADTITATGSMNSGRLYFYASLLANGKVLAAGAGTSAEIYDPTAGTWSNTGTTYGGANTGWYGMQCAAFGDGTPYIPGCGGGQVNIYAAREGAFYTVPSRTLEAMGASMVSLNDGRVFVCGGDPHNISGQTAYAVSDAAISDKLTAETTPSISLLGNWSGERWFASTSMTLTGKNLGVGATVNFGSTTGIATTYTAGTSNVGTLSFTVPESEFWEVGNRNVTVTYNGVTTSALTFTVTQPTALIQDLRADRGITLNGSTVSSWSSYDTSGDTNRNVTQATASVQPGYSSSNSDFNNKPTVNFIRANYTRLNSGTFSNATFPELSIAAVVKSTVPSGGIGLLSDSKTGNKRPYLADYNQAPGYTTGIYTYHGNGNFLINTTRPTVASAMFVQFEGALNATVTQRVFVRSASTGVSDTSGTNDGFSDIKLGYFWSDTGTGSFDGSFAEWLMFSSPLTQTQRTRLGNYFSNRYGSGVMTP